MIVEGHALPTWEAVQLLQSQGVGRLCILDHGCPIALPANFQMIDGTDVILRTKQTSLIGRYEGPASLEADHVDLVAGSAWSVVARGMLSIVHDHSGLPDPRPWVGGDRFGWMRLAVTTLSARRFAVAQHDGFAVEWSAQ
jgi:hypothetical protein